MSVEQILKRSGLCHHVVPSDIVTECGGKIVAIEDYYPDNSESTSLSIALSYSQGSFLPKCWLSVYIPANSSNKPIYRLKYKEFYYKGIHYHPYSIQTARYQLTDVINLCDGLYRYVEENKK